MEKKIDKMLEHLARIRYPETQGNQGSPDF
jgi:hypothetical protein